ncbi:MAG: ATPase [Acidobacteriaceae bacterium]
MKSFRGFRTAKGGWPVVALGVMLWLPGTGALRAQSAAHGVVQSEAQGTSEGAQQNMAAGKGGSSSTPSSSSDSSGSDEIDQYWVSAPVVKLGGMLGMKPETASHVFQLINLLIVGAGIGYGLLKLLPPAIRRRNQAIQKHLVEARTVTEEAKARLSAVEERLAKLDGAIAAIRMQAESDLVRDEQLIKAGVEEEKQKILAAAEAEIQSATNSARRELQRYAAELAVAQAERKLVVTVETDRQLVEGFARRLGEGSNN